MQVREVMSDDPVTVDVDASVQTAVGRMLREGIGSVVVTSGDDPAGILTETDALKAGYLAERRFADIPVTKAMTRDPVTIPPSATTRRAANRMRAEDVKKLVVVDGIDLVGVVTVTDLARNQTALVREAHRIERGRGGWEPDS
ncbi:CBS domain-containing protein [Halobaculum sp. D14]|uniref:CBS domain-containing protein n=1 Tax=unclassified Halobaculum TaxID=2640896 RepID=UPI003EB6B2B3